jgi:copper chaperone CopZ
MIVRRPFFVQFFWLPVHPFKNLKIMKFILFFSTIFLLNLTNPITATAQTNAPAGMTSKFKVYGNCGMCEKRIEKAAKIKGVTKADWDGDSQMLTIQFNEKKVTPAKVQKAVAAVGHDTDNDRAKDKVYNKLPDCCQYERPLKS